MGFTTPRLAIAKVRLYNGITACIFAFLTMWYLSINMLQA